MAAALGERSPTLRRVVGVCHFPAGEVVCAVSGGADSLALLALAVAAGSVPTAVHVDHGLRPGSAAEAAVVATAAAEIGVPFRAVTAAVDAGPNLEARARRARRRALPAGALTGHTADDQAETVLLALLRGSGVDGLAGMAAATHPILGVRRADTHRICAELGWEPVRDPTNDDPRHRRNRVRHELVPLLDDIAARDVVPLLARTAELARVDGDFVERVSVDLDPTDAPAVAAAPEPVARRALRRWLRTADPSGERHPPDSAAVERVLAVARGEAVATHVSGGIEVRRSRQRLTLRRVAQPGVAQPGVAQPGVAQPGDRAPSGNGPSGTGRC